MSSIKNAMHRGKLDAAFLTIVTTVTLVCVYSISAVFAAGAPSPDWVWPASAADPELRRSITEGRYTDEELRNIRKVLEFVNAKGRGSNPIWWAPKVKSQGGGFRGLEEFYGNDEWGETSIHDRTYHVNEIIAKDDRVWVAWMIEGHHTEKLLGFPPTGKLLRIRESAMLRLRDGRITELDFRGDDLALYTQAGGKLQFPK